MPGGILSYKSYPSAETRRSDVYERSYDAPYLDLATSYLAVIIKYGNGYSAYVPDLPGCVAVSDSLDEVRVWIRDGVALHVEVMQQMPVPQTTPDNYHAKEGEGLGEGEELVEFGNVKLMGAVKH